MKAARPFRFGRLVLVLLGVAIALVVVEAAVRIHPPAPRVQMIRGPEVRLRELHGVPVWTAMTGQQNDDCVLRHPEWNRILFLGDSITFGSGIDEAHVFTALLEARLNSLHPDPGFCVLNYAQPGFGLQQSMALAMDLIPQLLPQVVLWGIWDENRHAVMLGDTAYDVGYFPESGRGNPRDAEGYPCVDITCSFPWGINRWLFVHSEAWRDGTLSAGRENVPRPPESMTGRIRAPVAAVVQLVEAARAKLVLYFPCLLDRPFVSGADENGAWHRILSEFVRAHGVTTVELGDELAGRDLKSLGVDQVHFNVEGHKLLVPIFERLVLDALAPQGSALPRQSQQGAPP